MKAFIKKKLAQYVCRGKFISIDGSSPDKLTNTQKLFIQWNAERLKISPEESQRRYFLSWSAVKGGHSGSEYRSFNMLSYQLYQVFFNDSDTEGELCSAYHFHNPMHFLRFISYPEPQWDENNIIIKHLSKYSNVDIIDYGCGLAQTSRSLALYLKQRGIAVSLFLVDFTTIRKDFLLWLGEQSEIKTTFLDVTVNTPIPDLPKCDICIATEFFEHVYEPLKYFQHIHNALKNNGLLITNISDHKKEFMHVTPNLIEVRNEIQSLPYDVITAGQVYKKRWIAQENIQIMQLNDSI
jgi:SAM-dependent methyltransferase